MRQYFFLPTTKELLGHKVSVAFGRVFVSAIARRRFSSELMKHFAISMTIGVMTTTNLLMAILKNPFGGRRKVIVVGPSTVSTRIWRVMLCRHSAFY